MAVDTYTNLKAEIEDHLDFDLTDDNVDTLIDLAEARHKRDIRIRDMVTRSTATVSSRFVSLPSDFLEGISYRLLTDPVTILEEVSIFQMNRVRDESTGKPTRIAIYDDQIEFDIAPDDSYTLEIFYRRELEALSDNNASNAILDRAPDAYLYGSLLAAEALLGNDPRIEIWAQLYRSAVDKLNGMDRRRSGPLHSRVVGDTP